MTKRRPRGLLRRMSLRGRFALLAAAAVSIAVIAAALASYFLVAGQLRGQVNNELVQRAGAGAAPPGPLPGPEGGGDQPATSASTGASGTGPGDPSGRGRFAANPTTAAAARESFAACFTSPVTATRGSFAISGSSASGSTSTSGSTSASGSAAADSGSAAGPAPGPYSGFGFGGFGAGGPGNAQLVFWDGANSASCSLTGADLSIAPCAAQQAVAAGTQNDVFYDTYAADGEHVRVYTVQLGPTGAGYAVSFIQSLDHVDSSLRRLEVQLALAALAGVALATIAGLVVARSAVRPVRRLTRAVEYVARTEDLSYKLPVSGRDEIDRLGAAFNTMNSALAKSRDRQRRLIADAGHELRTPLTSLRTNVDLLLRSERTGRRLAPERRETMLVSVDQQLRELSELVTDLLELARGREGGARRVERVPLHECVERALDRARLRGPGIVFDVSVEPWYVTAEPTGLDRAVMNLLDNAVKFSPSGGPVTVRLAQGVYSVRDHGPGIAPRDAEHVFERFWRSDSARSLPGSGLGLAIVAQVAQDCGGRACLANAPGGGAVASLRLPGEPG